MVLELELAAVLDMNEVLFTDECEDAKVELVLKIFWF